MTSIFGLEEENKKELSESDLDDETDNDDELLSPFSKKITTFNRLKESKKSKFNRKLKIRKRRNHRSTTINENKALLFKELPRYSPLSKIMDMNE